MMPSPNRAGARRGQGASGCGSRPCAAPGSAGIAGLRTEGAQPHVASRLDLHSLGFRVYGARRSRALRTDLIISLNRRALAPLAWLRAYGARRAVARRPGCFAARTMVRCTGGGGRVTIAACGATAHRARRARVRVAPATTSPRAFTAWSTCSGRSVTRRLSGRRGGNPEPGDYTARLVVESMRSLLLLKAAELTERDEPPSIDEVAHLALALHRIEGANRHRLARDQATAETAAPPAPARVSFNGGNEGPPRPGHQGGVPSRTARLEALGALAGCPLACRARRRPAGAAVGPERRAFRPGRARGAG